MAGRGARRDRLSPSRRSSPSSCRCRPSPLPKGLPTATRARITTTQVYLVRQAIFLVKLAAGSAGAPTRGCARDSRCRRCRPTRARGGLVSGAHQFRGQERGLRRRGGLRRRRLGRGRRGRGGDARARRRARRDRRGRRLARSGRLPALARTARMRDLMDDWGVAGHHGPRALAGRAGAHDGRHHGHQQRHLRAHARRHLPAVGEGARRERAARARARGARPLERELFVEEVPEAARGRSNVLAEAGRRQARLVRLALHAALREGLRRLGPVPAGLPQRVRKQSTQPQLRARDARARRPDRLLARRSTGSSSSGTRAVGVTGRFVHPATHAARRTRFTVRAKQGGGRRGVGRRTRRCC